MVREDRNEDRFGEMRGEAGGVFRSVRAVPGRVSLADSSGSSASGIGADRADSVGFSRRMSNMI